MPNKNRRKILKSPNKKRITSALVAEVVGCAPSTVSMVKRDERSKDSNIGQRIEVAEMLLEEGMNKLVNEVKRVVKF